MAGSFDWTDFAEVAAFCRDWSGASPNREAMDRTAVSRAYYAAHCVAAERTSARGWFHRTKTGDDHRLVWEALRKHGHVHEASLLRALCEWRRMCDYEKKDNTDFAGMASRALNDAHKAISGLPSASRW
jgi:hypothetical protein